MATQTAPQFTSLSRAATMLARAIRRRCPNCGHGDVFLSYFRLRTQCLECGLVLDRGESGYQVGGYMFNIIAAELVFAGAVLAILAWTWPDPPWTLLQYGGGALMLLMPVVFYPFSRTLFLAFDLIFRPQGSDGHDRG